MEDLRERYQKLSNLELLKILNNKADYKPEAIQIAEQELQSRQLSDFETKIVLEQIQQQKSEENQMNRQIEQSGQKLQNWISSVYRNFNLFEKGEAKAERIKRGLSLIFSILLVVWLYRNRWMLKAGGNLFEYSYLLWEIVPKALLLTGIVLFSKNRKTGWVILAAYTTYLMVFYIPVLFNSYFYQPIDPDSPFADFLSPPPFFDLLMVFLFYLGLLYSLCLKGVLELFEVSSKTRDRSIGWSVLLSIALLIYLTYYY